MIAEIRKHQLAYAFLAVFLTACVFLFLSAWPNRVVQRYVALGLTVGYFLWGIVTHTKSNHLTARIAIEYFAMACLAGLLLGLITY